MIKSRIALTAASVVAWSCGGNGGMEISPLDAPGAGAPQSADPALAVAPASGELVLGWIEGDGAVWSLYTARSKDSGGTWSRPVKVAGGSLSPQEVHPHGESSPRLVMGPGGRMAFVWPNNIKVEGRKWPAAMLRFSRSEDGGQSWSGPVTLNDDTTAALVSHQFHGATLTGDSGIAVAWMDERHSADPITSGADGHAEHAAEPDATIYLAMSRDFGRSWGPNRIGWKEACPCCRISLARGADGHAVAAWRKHFPGNIRDVVTATLTPAPSEPQRVHPDDWAYAGCPHTGPALATGADGSTHVAWYNGKQGKVGVYYVRQRGQGGSVAAVELISGSALGVAHPAVAALPGGGALAAYDVSGNGEREIRVARLGSGGRLMGQTSIKGSGDGKYPQLAVLSDTVAVVGWTAWVGESPKLRVARVALR